MLKSKIEPLELKAKRLNKELYSKIEMYQNKMYIFAHIEYTMKS